MTVIEFNDSIWTVIERGHSANLVLDGRLLVDQRLIHPEHGTLLAHAIRCGRGNFVHTLLRHSPWLEYEHRGDSLLHLAVRYASRSEVAQLLDAGLSPDAQNAQLESPLHYAARFDKAAAAIELMSRGADARALNRYGQPASHVALGLGHVVTARAIMDSVPRLIPNHGQCTELHVASINRLAAFVAYLANRFGDVDRQDEHGRSALHLAASVGDSESVKNLLAAKANRRLRDHEGATPADLLRDAPTAIRLELNGLLSAA